MNALLLAVLVATAPDAPLATRLPDGSVLLNPQAAKDVDKEITRLKTVERQHNNENTAATVTVVLVVGVVVGVVSGFAAGALVASAYGATK